MSSRRRILQSLTLLAALAAGAVYLIAQQPATAGKAAPSVTKIGDLYQPLQVTAELSDNNLVKTGLNEAAVSQMRADADVRLALPLGFDRSLELELEPTNVISPSARFVSMKGGVAHDLPAPDVLTLRGRIAGEPNSYAYISFADGLANGYITAENGVTYYVSSPNGATGEVYVSTQPDPRFEIPEGIEYCGIGDAGEMFDRRKSADESGGFERSSDAALIAGGPKVADVAIDADQMFVDIFGGDETACNAYIAMLVGAISNVYERDVDTRMELVFVRLWSSGGEPFDQTSLSTFRQFWQNDDIANLTALDPNFVHLFSGRRDLPFGGIAYIADACAGPGQWAFGISGYLHGAFSAPLEEKSLDNWDVVVIAHEMGHNSGSGHTHDGGSYTPVIDNCGNGVPQIASGTILSYCHIHTGYMTNIEVRFHRRVQVTMQEEMDLGGCLWYDCNGNGIPDDQDILGGEPDVNVDGVPDVCQDCDSDGTPDFDEISGGAPDIDANGIPDECQPDCDGDGFPDEWAIAFSIATDDNGNNIPDECEPDCNGNLVPDFVEIGLGVADDDDRDGVPDECQDCDGNFQTDWKDLQRQHNVFVCDRNGLVREYHRRSGWPVEQYPVPRGMGIVVDNARNLLVTNDYGVGGGAAVYRIDPVAGTTLPFIAAGGQLQSPTDILIGSDNNLYIADRGDNTVKRFDQNTGAFIDVFVTSGAGGLLSPYALAFTNGGELIAGSEDGRVLEFDGSTGTYLEDYLFSPCCDLPGDADNSGSVNIGDVTFILGFIFSGGPPPPCAAEGDADGSGSLNIADATYLIALIFSSGPAPVCGPEPENGNLTQPRGLMFLASGDLLVTSYNQGRVLQFDTASGLYQKDYQDLQDLTQPWALTLGRNGNTFIVRASGVPRVIEYVPEGRYHRYYVRNEADMCCPTDLVFMPASPLDVNQNDILDACE